MRTRFQQIKKKYTANLVELKDMQDEHEEEKEALLDTIRYQEKEVKKYQAIMAILMNPDQVETIINNAQWNEEGRQWDIPHFTYREKVVNFPKLHGMTKDMIDQERDRKEIVFRDSKRDKDFDKRASYDGYKINSIVRNAREGDPAPGMASVASGQYFKGGMNGKTSHLTPLKTESYDRAKADLLLFDDSRKKRTERLDPIAIGGNDHKKYV